MASCPVCSSLVNRRILTAAYSPFALVDGQMIKLRPQAAAILDVLARAKRPIDKDTLIKRLDQLVRPSFRHSTEFDTRRKTVGVALHDLRTELWLTDLRVKTSNHGRDAVYSLEWADE